MKSRLLFLRDYSKSNSMPVGCLAVSLDRDNKKISYAFSTCSPRDTWNAKIARDVASGRLNKKPTVIEGDVPKSAHDITRTIMAHIIESNKEQSTTKSRAYLAYESAVMWLNKHGDFNSKQSSTQ